MDKAKVRCLGKQKKKGKNVKWRKGGENTCFQRIRSQSVKFSTTHELNVKYSHARRLGVKYSILSHGSEHPCEQRGCRPDTVLA